MSKQIKYLAVTSALCNVCNKSLPISGDYITCHNCGNKYHYSPCATLSESTYSVMNAEKKASWKCHNCRGDRCRSKSPNNLYQEIVHDDQQQQEQKKDEQTSKKQQRNDDDEDKQNEANPSDKRFKDSIYLNSLNSNVSELKIDLSSFKSTVANALNNIKTSINCMTTNITTSQNALREEMSSAFIKLTETMSSLATQVNDLKKENIEKDIRIQKMENKINSIEQQLINKNVEIKNVHDINITAVDAIKTIAASVNVNIQDTDINNAYKIKHNEKIIVEFCSLNKKQELMSKLRGHRVKRDFFFNTFDKSKSNNNVVMNQTNQNNKNNTIYINDQLTPNNRRLLWLSKNKASESGWKFVWVRNGHIFAKKTENSKSILILNLSDIELIA